jgi:hypothetical protein
MKYTRLTTNIEPSLYTKSGERGIRSLSWIVSFTSFRNYLIRSTPTRCSPRLTPAGFAATRFEFLSSLAKHNRPTFCQAYCFAERGGFEPPIRFHVYYLSKVARSTTLPSLHTALVIPCPLCHPYIFNQMEDMEKRACNRQHILTYFCLVDTCNSVIDPNLCIREQKIHTILNK